jgi:hypothetical protein
MAAGASLSRKLVVRPGHKVLVVNAPAGYADSLEGATVVTHGDPAKADAVHVFVRDTRELARFGSRAIAGALAGATVWIAYPKKTSGVETDMTRDRGWDAVTDQIDAVSQVAIDDTWSALRFKPVAEVGRRGERH